MIALNVRAMLHVTHAAVAVPDRRRVDVAAVQPPVESPLTKFGLNGFTGSLRQELISERARVSVMEPGTSCCGGRHRRRDGYIVTRDRPVAVQEILVRAGDQTW
jgi:NAD(P)-dependent dehydrogenase (short-subunit alcohol dehydrogenase family)